MNTIHSLNYQSLNKCSKLNNFSGNKYSNVRFIQPLKPDTLTFSGKRNILKEYGINPDEVNVVSKLPAQIDKNTKLMLLEKIVEAHEQAAKNKEIGNFSDRCYATNMMFENGEWAVGSNIENTAENILCGERTSLPRLWNQTLEKLSLPKLKSDQAYKENTINGLKVRYLAMSSFKTPGEDLSAGGPCSDCLNWINEPRFFSPNTEIATIIKDQDNKYNLVVKNIKELLPYWNEGSSSVTDQPVKNLDKLEKTDKAITFMQENNITDENIYSLLEEAKSASSIAKTTELSGKNAAAAVLMDNKKTVSSERMDWTRRWFISPDLVAVTKAVQDQSNPVSSKVLAVAYYGNDSFPYIDSLGRISQDRGSGNTLVIKIEDNKIKVRTILDYMPYLYISSKKKS